MWQRGVHQLQQRLQAATALAPGRPVLPPSSSPSSPPQLDFVAYPQLLRPWIEGLPIGTLHEVGLAAVQELYRRRST